MTEQERDQAFRDCPILRDYLATMLQDLQHNENDDACEQEREPRDTGTVYTVSDELFAAAKSDCERFMRVAAPILADLPEYPPYDLIGSDLWLTRQGHGAGFWDREEFEPENVGNRLTELVGWRTEFPMLDAYIGDDGKVYF